MSRVAISACLAVVLAGALTPASVRTVHAAVAVGPATQRFDIAVPGVPNCPDGREFVQMYSSPVIADLNGDGHREVIAGFPDGQIRVFSTDAGHTLLWDRYTGGDIAASPTVADLDGNGRMSVIVSSYSGQVFVWDAAGNPRPGWPQSAQFGSFGGNVQHAFFSSVAVGDAFGDGRKELFASAIDQHTYAWFADGTPLPAYPHLVYDSALATPALADLEHRHKLDIVVGADTFSNPDPAGNYRGGTYWVYRPEGQVLWRGHQDEVPWSSPAIADFGDGNAAVIGGTGEFWHQTSNPGAGRYVMGFNQDGSVRPGFPSPTGRAVFASPAVGDVTNDGRISIAFQSEDSLIHVIDGNGRNVVAPFANAYASNNIEGFYHGGAVIAPVAVPGQNGLWVPGGPSLQGYTITPAGPVLTVDIPTLGPVFSTPAVGLVDGGNLAVAVTSGDGNAVCGANDVWHLAVWDLPAAGRTMPANAWPTFHGNNLRSGSNLPLSPPPPPAAHGYWMVASDGGVFPFGNAAGFGSTGGMRLNSPIIGMTRAPADNGYWLVAGDGGIFPFGPGARGLGSTGGTALNRPIVGMEASPGGNGYWLVASDGGIFPFGDAGGFGSAGDRVLSAPVSGALTTRTGQGYWLVTADGVVLPFGDAVQYGGRA